MAEESMDDKVSRMRGGEEVHDALVEVLSKYFVVPTQVRPYGTRFCRDMLKEHKVLWARLREVQDNMSFNASVMKAVCKEVAIQKKTAWRFSDDDVANFAEMQSTRLRIMCRHMNEASSKKPKPAKWAVTVMNSVAKAEGKPKV
jgi:hypothetical protein